MEPNTSICPTCHQPVLPTYYFCPNCGFKLKSAPLSTTVGMQIQIYLFSIILPFICFIFAKKWPGIKYCKSNDPKAKQIGYVAWALLIISTTALIWLSIVWTRNAVQSSINSLNVDLGNIY